jgi:hypothetical protein
MPQQAYKEAAMEENSMQLTKKLFGAFVTGGCMGFLGQLLMMIFEGILGAESAMLMPATLMSMSVAGSLLFLCGIYQKIEKIGGIGALMSFAGLSTGVAGGICGIYGSGVPFEKAVVNGLKPLIIIIGSGFTVSVLIGAIASFLT